VVFYPFFDVNALNL